MSTATTRTDPRILRTRQLIRDAFIDLLQEIELDKITVNRIAERATINRVTFYLHYRDIPDMMDKMADDMVNDFRTIVKDSANLPASTANDTLALVKILEHIAANAKFYKVLLASKRISVFTDRLVQLLADLIGTKYNDRVASKKNATANVPTDIVIWHSSSALLGTIVSWLRNDMPYTPSFLAAQLKLLSPIRNL